MTDDISRRIDDLLSGAIDEQVREQRVLNDMMLGVRDGVARIVGDVAALSARVTESRETSQGLREELPFLVQREVMSAISTMSGRVDVLETAVGELVASIAGLEDRVGPDVVIEGISQRLESLRAQQEDQAGEVTAEAARIAVETAEQTLRDAFELASSGMTELVERHHAQISRRLADVKKWTDDVEARMKALEKALEANVKMPGEVRKQLNELTGSTQDLTDSVLEEIRINADAASSRVGASVDGIDHQAAEMNRRFVEMNERLATFQEQVLAYLQVRDVALEERRDQIVTELLSDFLAELPERDRERTVGRLRTVFGRRRDRRDAERFRTGGAGAQVPRVSPDAIARAQAEMTREQRLSERPWAEQSYAEPARPSRIDPEDLYEPEADPAPYEAEPYDEPYALEQPASSKTRKAPAKKAAARKTTARKPAAKKKAAAPKKKGAAAQDAFEAIEEGPAPFEEPGPEAEIAEAGEIDVVEMDAFAQPAAAEETPEPAPKKAKAAAPKPKPSRKMTPPEPEAEESETATEAAPVHAEPELAAEPQPAGPDVLQEALARVQALVDQHRKSPGSKPKR